MNLEPVLQGEFSQKEKNKCINVYINVLEWNLDKGTDEPICRTRIETQMWRADFGHSRGRRRWDKLRE